MCLDNYGQYILPGKRFQPISNDHCTQCVCFNGKPENCLTITCRPPDNCKKSAIVQKKGSCCEFICLNPEEEEDVEKTNKLSAATTNKLTSLSNREYSESTNTIDHLNSNQLNDLEMNAQSNVQSNVQNNRVKTNPTSSSNIQDNLLSSPLSNSRSSTLNNVPNNEQTSQRATKLYKHESNSTTTDKRFSNLEHTLKKLMTNKNIKEEVNKNLTSTQFKFNDDKIDDQRQINPVFQNLGIGVGIGKKPLKIISIIYL